jgi:diguanylate cyclase (GGDEF)-like protein
MPTRNDMPPRIPLAPVATAATIAASPAVTLRAGQGEYVVPRVKLSGTQIGRNAGLKSGQVHSLVESTDGRIWMSGPCGLSCYDGSRVVSFDQTSGLTTQGLRGLGVDGEGRIWVGSDAGLDVVERDGTIRAVTSRPQWSFGPAKRIAFTPDGDIFIATSRGLITSSDGRTFAPVDHAGLANDVILDLAVDVSGRLAVASTRGGVSVLKNGVWTVIAPILYERIGTVTRVATGEANQLFIGGTAGLVCAKTESDLLHTPCPLLYTGVVNAVRATRGEVWVASSSRVRRLRLIAGEQDWSWAFEAEIVAPASINDLCVDSVGNIWCATDAAGALKISVMRDAVVQPNLVTEHVGNTGQIFSIRPGRDGTFLIGAEHAVFRAKPGIDDMFSLVKHVIDARVWDLFEQTDGTLWLATHAAGLLRVNPGGETGRVGEHHPVLNAPGRSLAWFDGKLWAGSLRGLVSIAGEEIEELCEADGASLGYVYTLLVDRNSLWIGTLGNGLWNYAREGGLRRVSGEGMAATGNSYAITRNEHGEIVAIQDNRIVKIAQNLSAKLIALCDDSVAGWCAQFLSADVLAVGTSDGLVEYNIRDGKRGRQIRCGGIGLANWEFTSSRALIVDYRNRLWCALNSGLTLVDLSKMVNAIGAPHVSLLDVHWEHATPTQVGAHYVTPAGNWRVTFRGFAAWLIDEVDITYRYKLVGFDETFSPLKRDAEFSFNSLPPGNYLLEAQAFSPLAGFGPVRQLATIEVTAPWWSKAGLDYAANALAAVKGVFSNRARNERLLTVNKELAQAIQERSRDVANANLALHEANLKLADLLRTDALTEIANRRAFDEAINREWKRAIRDDAPLTILMIDVDYFKAFNDRYGHPRGDACLRLVAQCLARSGREGIDTCARYGGEEFVMVLPNTPAERAVRIAARLCDAVAAMRIEHADAPQIGVVTASVGVAVLEPRVRESIAELMAKADASLYTAKRRGRNQVGPLADQEAKVQ